MMLPVIISTDTTVIWTVTTTGTWTWTGTETVRTVI